MNFKEISLQFLNRIVGIIVWVALWNLLDLVIPQDDVAANTIISIVGLIIWGFLGEYSLQQQRGWAELTPV
jgi:hypothetical protein